MRRYIILTNSIANIGGSQLYIDAKRQWLEKKGWVVDIFYYLPEGEIMVDGLKKYASNHSALLGLPPGVMRHRERENELNRIIGAGARKVVIESHFPRLALWGEMLASRTRGSHIYYIISENPVPLSPGARRFCQFKLDRGELFGIERGTVSGLLPGADATKTHLRATGCLTRPVSTTDVPALQEIAGMDMNLLTISRLEKPYMPTVCREVVAFCKSHPDKRFGFIIVGDSPLESSREALLEILKEAANLKVLHLGYMYPVAQSVFDLSDLFIGGSGSVRVAAAEGLRSIVVSPEDFRSIGYFGETTANTVYRSSTDIDQSVSEAIEDTWKSLTEVRQRHLSIIGSRINDHSDTKAVKVEGYDFHYHKKILNRVLQSGKKRYCDARWISLHLGKEIILALGTRLLGTGRFIKLKQNIRTLQRRHK